MTSSTTPSIEATTNRNHAVVIGASMAGLLAARVLLNHFDRVTVIERDSLPEQPENRQGVPQAHHIHVLLTKGYQILQEFFPDLTTELDAAGVPAVDWAADSIWYGIWGWMPRITSGLTGYLCSRSRLEWMVRQRLMVFDSLKFLDHCQVKHLLTDEAHSRVKGIQYQVKDDPTLVELQADLVVDASGRNSHLPQWLAKLGYAPPTETTINSFLGYSTRWYKLPDSVQLDWKVGVVMSNPPAHRRGGIMVAVENNQWALTVSGIAGDRPPLDEAGFMAFAKSLRSPVFYDLIKQATPISPIYGYRRTENCWRHYEKIEMPEGIVALGDAVCAFNPVYGQGMTTAALSAQALDQCLQQQPDRTAKLTPFFHKQLATLLETPWLLATSDDFRWETTEGGKPSPVTRLVHRYMDQVLKVATDDPQVFLVFIQVAHLMANPTILFQPSVLLQVLKQFVQGGTTPLEDSWNPPLRPTASCKV